jgi:excisionase family DNA binding protein
MNKDPKWMSIGEAAKYLGISRDTLRRWGKKGKIKAIRSPTNRRYYTQKMLDEVMAEGKSKKKVTPPEKRGKGTGKLILIGGVSFLAAALLALLLQSFLLP